MCLTFIAANQHCLRENHISLEIINKPVCGDAELDRRSKEKSKTERQTSFQGFLSVSSQSGNLTPCWHLDSGHLQKSQIENYANQTLVASHPPWANPGRRSVPCEPTQVLRLGLFQRLIVHTGTANCTHRCCGLAYSKRPIVPPPCIWTIETGTEVTLFVTHLAPLAMPYDWHHQLVFSWVTKSFYSFFSYLLTDRHWDPQIGLLVCTSGSDHGLCVL